MTVLDTRAQLPAALSELGLALSPQACGQLLGHLDLIAKWNRVYNLTAVRDPAEMWTHHLLDSLAAVAPLAAYWANRCAAMRPEDPRVQSPYGGPHILDVGSGAGLPGVTLAIALPQALAATVGRADAAPHDLPRAVAGDVPEAMPGAMPKAASALGPGVPPAGAGVRVTCVDTVAKKAGFIRQVAAELGLGGLQAVHGRIESLKPLQADVITCRAFASLSDIVSLTRLHLAPGGVWMALKGVVPTDEIKALPSDIDVFHVEPLQVPHLSAQRCLVWMRPRPQP